jgi:tetratricopeptide (TPR) repeat protein
MFNSELSNAWCGLANVLAQLGNRAEAIGWYEKYIRMRISSDRGVDYALVITFYKLLACYQEQGRFDDTLTAYRQVIEKWRKSHRYTESLRLIAQMESEMKWIEGFVAQSSSDSSVSEWEVSEYETDVNNTEDDDEADDADEEMNDGQDVVVEEIEKQIVEEGEKESELGKEDWSSFLHLDVPTP